MPRSPVLRSLPTFQSPGEGDATSAGSPWDHSFRREISSGLKVGIGGCKLLCAKNHSMSFYTSSAGLCGAYRVGDSYSVACLPIRQNWSTRLWVPMTDLAFSVTLDYSLALCLPSPLISV